MTLRLLLAHNAYLHRGGEEAVVENEIRALTEAGVDVHIFQPHNTSGWATFSNALQAPWGGGSEAQLEQMLAELRPDILHAHNLFPQLSPRVFSVAKGMNIKTVLTFHNFRPLCLNGLFLTPKKEVCERCAGGNYWHGIVRGCYRGSPVQSAGIAAHITTSQSAGWYDDVDRYIASNRFLRDKLVQGGLAAEKFTVQGNFLAEFPSHEETPPESSVIFLGRLSEEKGLPWLVDVFAKPPLPIRLKIAGSGPLEGWVRTRQGPSISYLGFLSGKEKEQHLRSALALILPSDCYENFPMAVVEANAYGIPAIVPKHGGMAEMVLPGINGEHYTARQASSFWETLEKLLTSPEGLAIRRRSRTHAENHFSKASFLKSRIALYTSLGGHIHEYAKA